MSTIATFLATLQVDGPGNIPGDLTDRCILAAVVFWQEPTLDDRSSHFARPTTHCGGVYHILAQPGRNSVQERCRSVLCVRQQQKHPPGLLQERFVASAAASRSASEVMQQRFVTPAVAESASKKVGGIFCLSSLYAS